jgi:prepilin-type N-terminal cleavage/methylation domain-containing protein
MPALEAWRRFADTGPVWLRVLRRLRQDEGFGLVELMIAMLILTVGLLALLSAFVSGATTLRRASRTATASTLADTQMELYRGLTYAVIALDPSTIPATSPYTTDSAYTASQVTATCSGTIASSPQCNASRVLTTGRGSPEGVVTAPVGSLYSRIDGSGSTAVYRKDSGSGNTGWTAIGGSNPDPDHGAYRIDTYVRSYTPTSGRAVKLVTIVVRDVNKLSGRALARISSSFDQSTGL